ncbi:MAG: SurA N-terminal domain-containing protein [Desulfobacterales bacterium]
MTGWILKNCFIPIVIGTVFILSGCRDARPVQVNGYLIRVGTHVVTVEDFKEAFEIAKVAYPHNAMQDPVVLEGMRLRLFNQLTDEMILMQRAGVLGIAVSDSEVEGAIATVKADYPEDTFQQTLHAAAISFSSWKKRLKIRLLIEKVIRGDLAERVEISPEDVAKYYGTKAQNGADDIFFPEELDKINEGTVEHFRRRKAEEAYTGWMKALKETYTVEINHALWQELSGG